MKKVSLPKMVWHVLRLSRTTCPLLFLLFFALNVGAGLLRAGNVFIKQSFFDVVEGLVLQSRTVSTAMLWGIALAVVSVLILVLQSAGELAETNYIQTMLGRLGQDLNQKASRVEPIVYEDKRFLDKIKMAYSGLDAVMDVTRAALFIVFSEGSYFIAMGSYFYTMKPLLLVTFSFSFLPLTMGAVIRKKMYTTMEYQDAPYQRKYEYFGKCIYSREYAKETRVWRADSYFGRLFRENIRRSSMLRRKTMIKSDLVELGLRFLQLLGYVATVVALVYYLIQGEIGIGAFAAVFTSMDSMFERMESLFQIYIPHLAEGLGLAQNYFAFLNLEEREGNHTGKLARKQIDFKNVDFSYPCSDKKAWMALI